MTGMLRNVAGAAARMKPLPLLLRLSGTIALAMERTALLAGSPFDTQMSAPSEDQDMSDDEKTNGLQAALDRVVQLEAELEASGEIKTAGDVLAEARAALHEWVETVTGVVSSPGVGRVTLIHANGRESKIASPDLPFLLSKPARFIEG